MTTRNFVWLSIGGGAWSLGSNWADVTDGISPSPDPPGAQDSVTVTGPAGARLQTINGSGAVAAGLFTGNTALTGDFSIDVLTVGGLGTGALLQLGAATQVSAGSVTVASGSLLAGGGSTLSVAGTLALGTTGVAGATLNATGGSAAAVLALVLNAKSDSIYVDPASILEVGSAQAGAAGYLTIDSGAVLSGQGSADAFGLLANNGTLTASGGTLTAGALSGTGTLQIGTGATLALNGICGAGQTIDFAGPGATLALKQEAFAPAGTLTGFTTSDTIDVRDSTISSASFSANGAAGGMLTLFYGTQVAARLNLAGNYAGSVFLTAGDGAGGTQITVAPAAGGGGGPSPGTTTPDQYAWTAAGSGAWNRAANWLDLTSGADPAAVAPGAADLVSITADPAVFSVIAGPANAAALSLTGDVALSGAYQIGTLAVGQSDGTDFTPGTLDVVAGSSVVAGTAAIADGAMSVSGSAALISVAGTLELGGSAVLGVGLPTADLVAASGGGVRAGGLVMGGGSGATLTTDPTGWVEIGGTGHQSAGIITIDAGGTLAGNGAANPLGALVDNGTVLAAGGTLSLGSVSGTGSLEIAAGATLELQAATAAPIVLDGAASAGSTLALTSARAAPTGTLTGFALGDAIDLEGSPLTSVQYAANAGSNGGSLLLIYNTTVVARIALAASLVGQHFFFTPDGSGGSLIMAVANAGGGGGGGQGGTDQLAWATQGSGTWGRASNWLDVTTGSPATSPPGSPTPVTVDGPGGSLFQSIAGTGISASLVLTGNTALAGSYTTGLLCIGQAATANAMAVAGALDIGPNTTVGAATGTLASGDLLCAGAAAVLNVIGTLALGGGASGVGLPDTLLAVTGLGSTHLGGLTLGGGGTDAVKVDDISTLEIGTLGFAAPGVFTVDPGALVTGSGTLNAAAPVLDNGSIVAQGGTLLVGGAVTGSGTLGIGTEATLMLGGAESCAIDFVGGGATLLVPGSDRLPTGIISGFAPGDSIVSGSPVDSVTYLPGAGGVGTLSLSVAGRAAGQLLLAGNFAGDTFGVVPDSAGAIVVSPPDVSGPPPGTVAPDAYRWTGAADSGAWSDAGNWADVTLGQTSAAVAPGHNDTVSIVGGTGTALSVTGPADAASLATTGTVSLIGVYAVGMLAVGSAQGLGVLALSAGAFLSTSSALVTGGLAVGGGGLAVDGTLTLGVAGALAASGASTVRLGAALLEGAGSTLAVDATASIEVGAAGNAAPGAITVDAGNLLEGAGSVGLSGQVVDQGTVAASGGTLVLGDVSGTGTLLAGADADLVLAGSVDPALTADFAAAGTLTLAGTGAPAIENFGTGDSILLSVSGAVTANYAATGAGTGVLSVLDSGGAVLDRLTLLGSQAGRSFSVAATGGLTLLTTQADNMSVDPGETSMTNAFATGPAEYGTLLYALEAAFPYVAEADIQAAIGKVAQTILLDYSTDGLPPADPSKLFGGAYDPEGGNLLVEVVAPLDGVTGGSQGPGGAIALQPGYEALFLQGSEDLGVTDAPAIAGNLDLSGNPYGLGHALLVGNMGADTIGALGDGDTLVGAPMANTTFFASLHTNHAGSVLPIDVYVRGGGNDVIATNDDNAAITTSGGASTISLGSSDNSVMSYGSDTIGCLGINGNDTIASLAGPGRAGDLVFASSQGLLTFLGGNAPSTVVGTGGDMQVAGGAGGTLLWVGSGNASYTGEAGAATIIGGAGYTSVKGGSGPVTVFGGTGSGNFSGAAGSVFVVGTGASTVTASAGDSVYISGAAQVSIAGSGGVNVYAGGSTANNIFQANGGNETLWGGAGNDAFFAGTGSDILVGGGGDDVFNFSNGTVTGIDTVVGFVSGDDKIALHGFGTQTPTMSTAYGDTVISLQNGAQIIVLNDTHMTSADFTFS